MIVADTGCTVVGKGKRSYRKIILGSTIAIIMLLGIGTGHKEKRCQLRKPDLLACACDLFTSPLLYMRRCAVESTGVRICFFLLSLL
jgi:hypothetical protein